MEKYRPAIIAGSGAFVLSLLIALVSGVGLPAVMLRPLIFGVGFFVFGLGTMFLFKRFLAETDAPGSNVDVSVDDADDFGIDNLGFGEDREGLEQNLTAGYTGDGGDIDDSFKPMDFNVLNENVGANTNMDTDAGAFGEESPQPVATPLTTGNQIAYARVPEEDGVANADPKKLASTIKNFLLDEE
jgi:hypothetical protein